MAETKNKGDPKDSSTDIKQTGGINYCIACSKEPRIIPEAPLCSTCYISIKKNEGYEHVYIKQTDAAIKISGWCYCKVCNKEPVLCNSDTCRKCSKDDSKMNVIYCGVCLKEPRISANIPACTKCTAELVTTGMKYCRICNKEKSISLEIPACNKCVKDLVAKKLNTPVCTYCKRENIGDFKWCVWCIFYDFKKDDNYYLLGKLLKYY